MDAEQTKEFQAVIDSRKENDGKDDFIESEAKPLENLDDIDGLVDTIDNVKDPVDSKDVKDTADDDVSDDDVSPKDDEPSDDGGEMVRFAVETYGLDPVYAEDLQKANLLVKALQNTAAKLPVEDDKSPAEELKDPLDGVNLEDFDEEVVKALTGLSERLKLGEVKNKELVAALSTIEQRESLKSQGESEAEFDELIKGFTDYEDLFGEGRTVDLHKNSKHFKNREEVWHHILLVKELRNEQHKPPLSSKVEMQRALASVHPKRNQELADKRARDEINKKLKDVSSSHTVPPTGVVGEEIPEGRQKALDALTELHKERTGR